MGSSPLARGARLSHRWQCSPCGLIPARAGSTLFTSRGGSIVRAHPRSRGEHVYLTLTSPVASGSSPLARGAPVWGKVSGGSFGLIPARAGSTCVLPGQRRPPRAHPRSRGEHSSSMRSRITPPGSSPLARGAREIAERRAQDAGLIPARAGSTEWWCTAYPTCRAHPRSRGEHARSLGSRVRLGGSSPLARGARLDFGVQQNRVGLIPARAGSTACTLATAYTRRAHPRSRGEHVDKATGEVTALGSSPLARGALRFTLNLAQPSGLIPARAGSTPACRRRQVHIGAHPRSRGEHSEATDGGSHVQGSSPLARGALYGLWRASLL